MVAATAVTVGSIIASAEPFVCAAVSEGIVIGVITSTFGSGTSSSVAGALGTAASSGAITGALVGGSTAKSAAIGAAVAGSEATGVTATSEGMTGTVTEFSDETIEQQLSFDCWKPILRDTSINPSKGMLLRDVLMDRRIKNVVVSYDISASYPQIKLQNVWGENFMIEDVRLPWNEIAAHAVPL